ncbi:MAG: hypothetical protein EU536_04835 [Promethearchaeota archaeon]|nr:MAG: hypothetical protein EU536_04835 [Candidatus Lokiarchaeota archaeon]
MQGDLTNPLTWLWIIIWTLLAWLMFFLTTWMIESKTVAKRKLGVLFLVAFLAVFIIPFFQVLESVPLLQGIAPYIAYLFVILLLIGLVNEYWKTAVIVGFIGIVLLLIIYNALLLAGVSDVTYWPLFV